MLESLENDSTTKSSQNITAPSSKKKISFSLVVLAVILLAFFIVCILIGVITYFATKSAHSPSWCKYVGSDNLSNTSYCKCVGSDNSSNTSTSSPATATTPKGPTAQELRLPKTLRPDLYEWTIKTYLPYPSVSYPKEKNFTFDGKLKITFECLEATDVITLNQNKLKFDRSNLKFQLKRRDAPNNSKGILLDKFEIRKKTQMIDFHLQEKMEASTIYVLQFQYQGNISDEVLSGIYRSKYVENGKTVWLAATQMEPVDARRALPCFDEPQMKAHFQTTIIHPADTNALSNGIETAEKEDVSATEGPGWVRTTFDQSPKMSTYLLAIAVSNFVYSERTTKRGTRFRIWARPSMLKQTKYALDAGVRCLTYYEDYYGTDFPMPKQDMIALPDFEAGAMENWGLITYREKYLLYDPTVYDLANKQLVAVVIAHELAHQWFGNLVTMKWWDDLWLNEGFATFLEFIGTDFISDGAFHMDDQFVSDAVQGAMNRDQLATSHPLYGPVERIQDLYEIFDGISYEKGGSILNMVNNVIGSKNFRQGLTIYLEKFKYSNAAHNDLWNSLSQAVFKNGTINGWDGKPLNVTKLMASWTLQMGFPVIKLSRNGNQLQIEQERFKIDPKALEKPKYRKAPFDYKWHVPVWYKFSDSQQTELTWLTPETTKMVLPSSNADWLLINPSVNGYYRVMYDKQGWNDLANQLKHDHTRIPVRSRSQLIDDSFMLARANLLDYDTALKMTEYLGNEDNYLGWRSAMGNFGFIRKLFLFEPGYEYFRKYVLGLVLPQFIKIDWNLKTEDVFIENKAKNVISWACGLGHEKCVNKAIDQSKTLRDSCSTDEQLSTSCNKVSTFLRRTVYCTSIRKGDTTVWNYFWQKYLIEQVQVEKDRITHGLSCSNEVWILNKMLNYSIEGIHIRKQDVPILWIYVSRQPIGRQIIFDFFLDKWDIIFKNIGKTKYGMKHVIRAATNALTKPYQIKQLEAFRKANPKANKFSVFDLQTEVANANAKWMEKNYGILEEWFKNAIRK